MRNASWFILIYQVADAESQELLVHQLQSLGGLIIQTEHNYGDYFVIVESPATTTALALHELVMVFDPQADLIGTHHETPVLVPAGPPYRGQTPKSRV